MKLNAVMWDFKRINLTAKIVRTLKKDAPAAVVPASQSPRSGEVLSIPVTAEASHWQQ